MSSKKLISDETIKRLNLDEICARDINIGLPLNGGIWYNPGDYTILFDKRRHNFRNILNDISDDLGLDKKKVWNAKGRYVLAKTCDVPYYNEIIMASTNLIDIIEKYPLTKK